MKSNITVSVNPEPDGYRGVVEVPGAFTLLQVVPVFEATARGSSLPYDVWLRAEFKGNAYEVQELRVSRKARSGPVMSEKLRAIPVSFITRLAVEQVILLGQGKKRLNLGKAEPDAQSIAEAYRVGVLIGSSPTQFVAEEFKMSRATAGRWISRARSEGFLGPALGTKAGEGRRARRG